MFRERPLKPLVGSRRIDESIKEHRAISLGQDERLVLRDCPPRGLRERRHAEVGELTPLKLSRPLNQRLRGFIDTKAQSFFSETPFWLYGNHNGKRTANGLTFQRPCFTCTPVESDAARKTSQGDKNI